MAVIALGEYPGRGSPAHLLVRDRGYPDGVDGEGNRIRVDAAVSHCVEDYKEGAVIVLIGNVNGLQGFFVDKGSATGMSPPEMRGICGSFEGEWLNTADGIIGGMDFNIGAFEIVEFHGVGNGGASLETLAREDEQDGTAFSGCRHIGGEVIRILPGCVKPEGALAVVRPLIGGIFIGRGFNA